MIGKQIYGNGEFSFFFLFLKTSRTCKIISWHVEIAAYLHGPAKIGGELGGVPANHDYWNMGI